MRFHDTIEIDNEEYTFPLDVKRKPPSVWLWPKRLAIFAVLMEGTRRFGLKVPIGIATSIATLMTGIYIFPFHLNYIPKILPALMLAVDKEFKQVRLEMFKNIKGNILDVGCATGHYFKYYANNPNVASIIAMEPDTRMHPDLSKTADKYPDKITITSSVMDEEFAKDHFEEFDGIILGNVLCEIDNYRIVLDCISQMLKPGGKIYFQEHVLETDPKYWQVKLLQTSLNFWWRRVVGCQCNKESVAVMKEMFKLWDFKSFTYYSAATVLVSRMDVGIACKPR
jgi:SAM-dependent methyltransferase